MGGRASDEIEFVFIQRKENRVTNHIAIRVARNKLFGLIQFKIAKGIHTKIGEQFECIGTFNIKIRHMVRQVEKGAGLPPCTLLISPVCEFVTHDREGVRSYLRIPQ